MVKRILHTQLCSKEENRCESFIKGALLKKASNRINNSGSCMNVASKELVDKFNCPQFLILSLILISGFNKEMREQSNIKILLVFYGKFA